MKSSAAILYLLHTKTFKINCFWECRGGASNMGANASQLEKEIGADQFPSNEHYFGLVNFGNTCYCNSVLQALYFCKPFRERVLCYKQQYKSRKETLLSCLGDLFWNIATQKRKVGTIAPKKFIARLRKENEQFDNYMQQDAHEFLIYLLNTIADLLQEKNSEKTERTEKTEKSNKKSTSSNSTTGSVVGPSSSSPDCNNISLSANIAITSNNANARTNSPSKPETTWIHDIFQGIYTSEIRCLNCETVSSKDETFLDLSVDIEQNTSITHCLRGFSCTETLCSDQKYYCETCCSNQEAQKRMRIKRPPKILALHLKRFKFIHNRHTKLSYRVVFPLELRLFNTSTDAIDADRLYDLVGVVIHCGNGPNRGHYISIVKSHGLWLLFDDDVVDKIDAATIEDFFGVSSDGQKGSECGYILFYQAIDSGS